MPRKILKRALQYIARLAVSGKSAQCKYKSTVSAKKRTFTEEGHHDSQAIRRGRVPSNCASTLSVLAFFGNGRGSQTDLRSENLRGNGQHSVASFASGPLLQHGQPVNELAGSSSWQQGSQHDASHAVLRYAQIAALDNSPAPSSPPSSDLQCEAITWYSSLPPSAGITQEKQQQYHKAITLPSDIISSDHVSGAVDERAMRWYSELQESKKVSKNLFAHKDASASLQSILAEYATVPTEMSG